MVVTGVTIALENRLELAVAGGGRFGWEDSRAPEFGAWAPGLRR